jgi:thiol:disulfide interchange protein
MKRASVWGVVLVVAMVAAVILLPRGGGVQPAGGAAALPWERDLPTALNRAGSENKLVMVDFYTDWCQWCKRLDQNTFSDAKVQEALQQVVTVRLNAEKDGREAAARFNVEGFPTLIFLNASGAEVGRIPGYMDPSPFLEELQDILKKA